MQGTEGHVEVEPDALRRVAAIPVSIRERAVRRTALKIENSTMVTLASAGPREVPRPESARAWLYLDGGLYLHVASRDIGAWTFSRLTL